MLRGADYAELAAFAVVAEVRSFSRAAQRLEISRSALSHAIRSLEERLGTRLLNRTTRSVALTEAGRSLLDRLAPALAEIADALDGLNAFRERPAGTVRLNLPRLAAEVALVPNFRAFAAAFPDVRLDLTVDDGLTDIVAGGFDAGIRPGELVQRDMVAVRITPDLRNAIVGSPAYFAACPIPRSPRDLADHACINYRWTGNGALYRWPFTKDGESLDVAVDGTLAVNDSGLTVAAALAGAGLACTLEAQAAPLVASGRLVRVLEDWCPPFPGFFLYYPSRRQMAPALRALIDFLKTRAG